jgi:predicted component of type VI protein secretion system
MDDLRFFEEPITERCALEGDVTTLGSAGVAQLHHLRALSATLEPARAHYTATAVEQLRALPTNVRRQVFRQVLSEHPMLAHEPAVQELALELGVEPSAMTGTATTAAFSRMEAILPALAEGLSALEQERVSLCAELRVEGAVRDRLPLTAGDFLAWVLDERVDPRVRADELARALRTLTVHARALHDAARQAGRALVAETDPEAIAARTQSPGWWPRAFRDAAVLASVRALHRHVTDGRRYLEELHQSRFAHAYVARASQRP